MTVNPTSTPPLPQPQPRNHPSHTPSSTHRICIVLSLFNPPILCNPPKMQIHPVDTNPSQNAHSNTAQKHKRKQKLKWYPMQRHLKKKKNSILWVVVALVIAASQSKSANMLKGLSEQPTMCKKERKGKKRKPACSLCVHTYINCMNLTFFEDRRKDIMFFSPSDFSLRKVSLG